MNITHDPSTEPLSDESLVSVAMLAIRTGYSNESKPIRLPDCTEGLEIEIHVPEMRTLHHDKRIALLFEKHDGVDGFSNGTRIILAHGSGRSGSGARVLKLPMPEGMEGALVRFTLITEECCGVGLGKSVTIFIKRKAE